MAFVTYPNLLDGERVLWSGAPERHPLFVSADLFLVPFSILWCGFAIYWETSAITGGAPIFFALWGIPFVLLGLYLVVGRLIVRGLRSRSTHYVVTNQRLVETSARPRSQVRQTYLRDLQPPIIDHRKTKPTNTIAFGQLPGFYDALNEAGFRQRGHRTPPPFLIREITQARHVADLIAAAQTTVRDRNS